MAEGRDEFQRGLGERTEGGALDHPVLGVGGGAEDVAALPARPIDDALIDEVEQDGQATVQGDSRPVFGAAEIVFQMQADVAERLFVQRVQVLIVTMRVVVGQQARPVSGKLAER